MHLLNYLEFLDPLQENFTRIYSTASGVISVLLVLWFLNFIIGLIQKTFATGKAFGNFYRNYLHRYLKVVILKLKALKSSRISSEDSSSLSNESQTSRQAT
tara:strand:- start:78 stop:380 length:303 start_codon:yes stop_codon:yes gene_type:complete